VNICFDEVVDHWLAWHRNIWGMDEFKILIQNTDGGLALKLDQLLPLDMNMRLMSEISDGRIAIFANFYHGGDGSPDANYLAHNFARERTRVVMAKDESNRGGPIGSTQFDWIDYGAKTDHWVGYKYRSIAAHKESRWEWHEGGDAFPWEETETYKAKRIKDRLTPDMVERYCLHLGIDLFDPDYYGGRGVIVRLAPPPARDDPRMQNIARYPNQ
jgi:hypothetical protein